MLAWRGCAELDVLFFKLTQNPSPHLGREGPLVGWLGLAGDNEANRRRIEVAKNVEMWWLDHFALPFFLARNFLTNPIDDIAGGTNVGVRCNGNGEVYFAIAHRLVDDMLHHTIREEVDIALDIADHCGAHADPLDRPAKAIDLDNISYPILVFANNKYPGEKIFNE